MSTLKEFLQYDPVAKFDRERIRSEVNDRFNKYLPSPSPYKHIGAIAPFATERIWMYWDVSTVETALETLEQDRHRTILAIKARRNALDRGMQNLFRPSPIIYVEESFSNSQSKGLVRLATEFLPEYLRITEHIFGNLLEVYWSIIKRKGVEGSFDLSGATAVFKKMKLNMLLKGYIEKIRNAIAHGKFVFTGFEIEFGDVNPDRLTSSEFLQLFDELWRTCNSLSIGIVLFWIRNNPSEELQSATPISIIERFAAAELNRTGFELLGLVESNTPLAGKQLHAAIKIDTKSRAQAFGASSRVALQLIEAGASNYDRFIIEIDQGERISSTASISPKKFKEVVEKDLPIERLIEAFTDPQLLWFDESKFSTRMRLWKKLLATGIYQARQEIYKARRENELWIGKDRYRIREVENISSTGIARLRIKAVLKNPDDAEDIHVVREILFEIVKIYGRRLVRSKGRFLDKGFAFPQKPRYMFIDLFKADGTIRWLSGGGWMGGNLIASAEKVRGNFKSVLIDNPDELYKGIRIRYTIDKAKEIEALDNVVKVISDIQKNRSQNNKIDP